MKISKTLKTIIKVCVSLGALAFVFTKIDFSGTWQTICGVSLWWLVVAVFFYTFSQVISSERVRLMLSAVPVPVDKIVNLRLYWLGMFYNFFLPGGVGGDGYKVFWLHRRYGVRVKPVVLALLGDRMSGLGAICIYTLAYAALRPGLAQSVGMTVVEDLRLWLLALIPVGVWAYWLFFRFFQRNLASASLKVWASPSSSKVCKCARRGQSSSVSMPKALMPTTSSSSCSAALPRLCPSPSEASVRERWLS